ncbi:MAG: hypothetical protein IKX14_07515, partial [Neisseriaceae bacterium]|nr:hypothetical protein [Neisseriaceae bacterium]
AALSAYFDGAVSQTQNIANVAQSALNAQLKAEQEIGAKHGDYDRSINVKEHVTGMGSFENPIDSIQVQNDLKQRFDDSPLMQKVSHNIDHKKASLGQEKQAMSEQVSGSLKDKHEATDTTEAGLMVKDIATDKGENAVALKENLEKGDYKAALGSVKDLATPGGTSSMFRTPEPVGTQSGLDPATEFFATLTGSSVAHADTVPLHRQAEPQQATPKESVQPEQAEPVEKPVEKPLSGSTNGERQVERQDDTPTANNPNSQEPARKPFWESGDSNALNNAQDAQQTQATTADNQADGQAGKSADTGNTGEEKGEENAQTAADMPEQTAPQTAPQNAPQFEVPEYLRQPENSGSLNDEKQAEQANAEPQKTEDEQLLKEQARDEENEWQNQADKNERLLAQQKAAEEQARLEREKAEKEAAEAEERRLAEQKAEEERKAEEQRRAEEEKAQEQATLDAMNKKFTTQTDAWAFTDPDKLKELQEQGLVDKPVVEDPLINHETGKGVSLKSADYEINNLKDKNGKTSFKGFGAGIDKSIKEASERFGVDEKDLRGFLKIERGWYGDP